MRFVRVFLLLGIIFIQSIADSIIDTSSTLESPNQTPQIPIVNGFKKLYSLHADNFIFLESLSPTHSNDANQTQDNTILKNPTISNKPKILLIMDDIQNASQIKQIQSLPLKIIPSIFPKTKYNPKTPLIAQKNAFYMIHLPLEAQNFEQKELEPIKVGTSKDNIYAIIAQIKQDFPNLLYINNHTGSKFTQSEKDMLNLLSVFDELGLKFIDSVTTPHPASEKISHQQKRLIMQRDIFLDNEISTTHTKAQLKLAIQKAQKKGYIIAICHPHTSTFKALKQMSDELNHALEFVTPKELESYLSSQAITHYTRERFYANAQ
ncbi:divergent polysaccharide deacetylase family protein [Helicobacter sp. MIT 05-5293]|uniref:divergent polysaccharide deacetylase family protein n=1 Tax=Helicobacter sp. MIT 05-5293 TaxID=1548149 RepID=UPI00068A1334|nr:divergent polysaccharide deacetylase family protein [Helicobacter sp. MIT 05-5293]TLD80836.1 divergent polysaccharide deacetylase family protein [Helicobacter sp. MIT 05-5293]